MKKFRKLLQNLTTNLVKTFSKRKVRYRKVNPILEFLEVVGFILAIVVIVLFSLIVQLLWIPGLMALLGVVVDWLCGSILLDLLSKIGINYPLWQVFAALGVIILILKLLFKAIFPKKKTPVVSNQNHFHQRRGDMDHFYQEGFPDFRRRL